MRIFEMSEKQMMSSSGNQMVAMILDILGIILVLVGGLYEYYHSKSGAGAGIFWLGIVVLIVALILFAWNMMMKKPMMKPMAPKA
jgi:drug/metabolite transporter (DMT)-like permease